MKKFDYEIVYYKVVYGNGRRKKLYSEDAAVRFAEEHKNENPCIYEIRRMIFD